MTVEIDSTRISSDRTNVSAISVGGGRWSIWALPGRQFSADQALHVLVLADALDGQPPIPPEDQAWPRTEECARSVGLSLREAILLLGLDYPVETIPARIESPVLDTPPRQSFSFRSLLAAVGLAAPALAEGASR